ncbi:MAG: TolC family protein [Prevotella sp.]|nr:TolC family protein [Prevotella sp.]
MTYRNNHTLRIMATMIGVWLGATIQAQAENEPRVELDSLATYIGTAIRNNPAVMSEYQAYQAKVSSARGAGVLNDPELSIGVYPSPMEQVNSKQVASFEVMQMFPWFGTLKADRQQMEYEAEAAYQKFREDGIALAFDMQKQWYQLLATQEKIRALDAKIKLLNDIKEVAIYQYKSMSMGKFSRMSDQLRLDAEVANLKEQKASMEDEFLLQKQQLNISMHRHEGNNIVVPDSIVQRELPIVDWSTIEANDPKIAQLTAMGKSYEAMGEKAKNMGKPMIGVGVQYMLNNKTDMPRMANMNGNDMTMLMLKVSLPIYRRKINMEQKSAQLMQASTVTGIDKQKDMLRSEYLSIEQRSRDIKRKVQLYDQEVDILNNTLSLMQKEYISGSSSLTDILLTTREQIDYALKKAEARAQYNTVVAEYEKMLSKYDYAVRSDK